MNYIRWAFITLGALTMCFFVYVLVKALRVVNMGQCQKQFYVFKDNIPLLPIVGYAQGLRQGRDQ